MDSETGNKVIAFKSVSTGKYLTATTDAAGGLIYATSDTDTSTNTQFSVYSWGQDGYSYLSLANNKFWGAPTASFVPGGAPTSGTGASTLATIKNNIENQLPVSASNSKSSLPTVSRSENNSDGSISLVFNSYGSFSSSFEAGLWNGNYLSISKTGSSLGLTSPLTDAATAAKLKTDSEKFIPVVISNCASNVSTYKADDYAVVVVGTYDGFSSGEGSDRSDLAMGKEQYEVVKNVAAQFPGRTIVVLKSDYPVLMQEIQDNDNVASVVYQPYAGQYDGYALAQTLFGDSAPTGKLATSWYSSMGALPAISQYSIPQTNKSLTLDKLDPRFTVDMTTNDPQETGLTYMYTKDDVTYPFEYGLTYSSFSYSNLKVSDVTDTTKDFTVSVNVTNTGKVEISDVVQLYAKNNNAAYSNYSLIKKLISFGRVTLKPGETQTLTMTVDPSDLQIWNANTDTYTVESGNYTLMLGESSSDIKLTQTINVNGTSIGSLNASTKAISVFDHSFASSNVIYDEVSKANTISSLG